MPDKTSFAPIHLLSVGSFGQAVGCYLKENRVDIIETVVQGNTLPLPELWPASRAIFLASWRPVPLLCELLDDLVFGWRRPFVPLILDSASMRLGPIIMPGSGCCWHCWMQRSKQHARWPQEQSALLEHYAAHADTGPQGYLEAFALMAAVQLERTVNDLDSGTAVAGHIWKIDMITREVTTSTVIGIHDCAHCGLHRAAPTRSFTQMKQEISYLWSDT